MKLDPGFTDHWKTRQLQSRIGADGIVAILRLWGRAQIQRQWCRLEFTPKKLKAVCGFPGDEQTLWEALTDEDAPWLDADADGTFTIHGFEEHQAQVIALWKNGSKGGRPPNRPQPPHPLPRSLPPNVSQLVSSIEPNANQMVLSVSGEPTQKGPKRSKARGTIEELKAYAIEIGMKAEDGETCFHTWEGNGWTNNGKPVKDWRATMNAWKGKGYLASQKRQPANRHTGPLHLGGRAPAAVIHLPPSHSSAP